MPNLMDTGVQELREYNAPGTLAIQSTMEDDEDILMTTKEVQMRPNKNENRKRDFRSQSNNSYNPATTPEATTPVPLEKSFIWKPEPGDEGYDTVNGGCAEKSIYLHPRVGFQGRDFYDCAETESIFSEQTENGVRPLTFTQATNALNNIELDFSKLNTNLQRGNGFKSAESIFDGDETLVERDDPYLRYERACEAELNEVTAMLKRMQMEKQNLSCIIGNTSHYQSELKRKLQMLQRNRKNGYRRSPFGAPYAQPGVHPIDVANNFPVNLSLSSPIAGRSRSRPETAEYQNYLCGQPHPPIGCYQHVSGSMDSIDDISRNSTWTPDDNEQPNSQIQSMLNHHYMHNPHAMQRFGTDGSFLPFIPGNEKPMTPRSKFGKHSNIRYSMYDTTQIGSPLVSPTHYSEGYPEHLTQKQSVRSPENMEASQRFEDKNIYLHPTKPLPQTTFVTQYFKPPNDSFNIGTSGQSRHSFHISQAEVPSMGHFSHISRADIRRRISGSERPRPYSQDRLSSEQSTQDVRRRTDVSQIQKRRNSHMKRCILQKEIDETNNFSGPEFSLEGDEQLNRWNFKRSTNQTNHDLKTLRSEINSKDNSKPAPIETTVKTMTSEPNETPVQTKSIGSPHYRRARSIIGSRMNPVFDPLSEHSEEDLPSISDNSCAKGISVKREAETSDPAVITLRDPCSSDEKTQIGINSFSVNNKEQSPESGKTKGKHVEDPL